jgi:hypothetical protein
MNRRSILIGGPYGTRGQIVECVLQPGPDTFVFIEYGPAWKVEVNRGPINAPKWETIDEGPIARIQYTFERVFRATPTSPAVYLYEHSTRAERDAAIARRFP